ncbi:MAG: ABC transporter permease [Lachnospiraceae bacterium]|nr:ABC transporter permease [Lachnospiraceae bacterium]
MRKTFLLARSYLRRSKGQSTSLFVLILLAAAMLHLWLILSLDYKQNFSRSHDRLNAQHVTLALDDAEDSDEDRIPFLTQTLEKDARTKEFFLDEVLHMVGTFEYNGGEINSDLIFSEKNSALARPVGKIEIVEEGPSSDGIYLPVLYRSDDIAIGKDITISIGNRRFTYPICGFFNSIMTGSHNCALCELILTEDKYKELEETGCAPRATLCSVRLQDKSDSEDYEAMLKNALSAAYPDRRAVSNSYALVSRSRYISQMICSAILSAMAFFILLIALVVIAASIVNHIQKNMKTLGALKAIGYTSRQLIGSLLWQFLGISLSASAAGAALSYALFPPVNRMMISQTGIPYALRFLPLSLGITLLTLNGAVAAAAWLASRRIRKIEPIAALRQGIPTHNFKKNHVPLAKTRAPLSLALALKTTCSGIKHNLTVAVTMLVLSLIVAFSGLMWENVIVNMTPFIHMIVGETTDSCLNINAEKEEEFLREMTADPRVEKAYLYTSLEVRHVGGIGLMTTICDDFSKANNQDVVFKGRFPKFDNEIAVAAKYAREQGLQVGDEIKITANGKEADYLISGFTQTSNNLGKDCLLTRAGYERLSRLDNTSYYLNLRENTDIDSFNMEAKERFKTDLNMAINVNATIESASSVYVALMTAIVIGVLILSLIVISFVLYLLVRSMLAGKQLDYGILKALGFTTGQLILQTAFSFLPALILSTGIGLIVSSLIINPLTALFLNGIGIVKSTFTVPGKLIAGAGLCLILSAFAITCLLSLRIRKISPKNLLTGE